MCDKKKAKGNDVGKEILLLSPLLLISLDLFSLSLPRLPRRRRGVGRTCQSGKERTRVGGARMCERQETRQTDDDERRKEGVSLQRVPARVCGKISCSSNSPRRQQQQSSRATLVNESPAGICVCAPKA